MASLVPLLLVILGLAAIEGGALADDVTGEAVGGGAAGQAAGEPARKLSVALLTVAVLPKHRDAGAQYHAPPLKMSWASLVNKVEYSELHNLTFVPAMWTPHSHLAPAWGKVPALIKHMKEHDWVWSLDLDAWITNMNLTIEEHVFSKLQNKQADLIIAKDCNGINTGSMFIRNTEWSVKLLEQIWELHNRTEAEVPMIYVWWEQAALMHILSKRDAAEVAAHVEYVPQKAINAYPNPGCGAVWEQGDFVLHMAGLPSSQKLAMVSRIAPFVLPSEEFRERKQRLQRLLLQTR